MKGDFSRDTFNKGKHFSRVLLQQGRVLLDADHNEQTEILLHYLRTLAADLIGPFAGPQNQCGFAISTDPSDFKAVGFDAVPGDFLIGPGRYYVDGVLCENESWTTLTRQPSLPNEKPLQLGDGIDRALVYLDVWERHVSALEDDSIREPALGGPDTATRSQVVWQVKVQPIDENPYLTCSGIRAQWAQWIDTWQPAPPGLLKARLAPQSAEPDPCIVPPESKYRGLENHLYRVEIHDGIFKEEGEARTATFKWSRDNGSVAMLILSMEGKEIVVQCSTNFAAGQWVEISDASRDLRGQPGDFFQIVKVEGDTLSLNASPTPGDALTLRHWDQRQTTQVKLEDGVIALPTTGDQWITLENGVQVSFDPSTKYRSGDYWLVPARTTGAIEWPVQRGAAGGVLLDESGNPVPLALPPHGIHHHYAPLAILQRTNGTWNLASDCRCQFVPLNGCGLYSYGEGGIGAHLLDDPAQ